MALILPRRRFLAGLVGIIAAPAIVKAENIMKVASPRVVPPADFYYGYEALHSVEAQWTEAKLYRWTGRLWVAES